MEQSGGRAEPDPEWWGSGEMGQLRAAKRGSGAKPRVGPEQDPPKPQSFAIT